MATETLQIVINAKDNASKPIGGVNKSLGSLGKGAGLAAGAVVTAAAAIGAAVVGIGAAGLKASAQFDEATKALVVGTGATGDALRAMQDDVLALSGSVSGIGRNMGDIGAVLAEVNTRTGATGDALQSLTGRILEFSRLAGVDGVVATANITRVMGDWGVQMQDSEALVNNLFAAGQTFGISLESLGGKLVQFGAPLRQMGFSLEEATAMLGKWEREGVNTELVIGSLRIAAGAFARENIPLREGLAATMEAIKGAKTESEGLNIAMQVFGARAGPDMAAAIREGRFELDSAISSLQGMDTALADATNATVTWQDKLGMLKTNLTEALIPLGKALEPIIISLISMAEKAIPAITAAIEWLSGVISNFSWSKLAEISPVGSAVMETFNEIRSVAVTNLSLIMEHLANFVSWAQEVWATHGDGIMQIVQTAWNYIYNAVQTVLNLIIGFMKVGTKILQGDWSGAWEALKATAYTFMENIYNGIRYGLLLIIRIVKIVLTAWMKAWQWTWDKLNEITGGRLTAAVEFIKKAFLFIVKTFAQGWNAAIEFTAKGLEGIIKGIGEAFHKISRSIARFLDKLPFGVGRSAAASVRAAGDAALRIGNEMASKLGGSIRKLKIKDTMGEEFLAGIGEFTDEIKTKFEDGLGKLEEILTLDLPDFAMPGGGTSAADFWSGPLGAVQDATSDVSETAQEALGPLADLSGLLGEVAEKAAGGGGGGGSSSPSVVDAFQKLQDSLTETLDVLSWKLEQGLIDPIDAIKAKMSALATFAEAAFKAGFVDEANVAAEQIRALQEQLRALGEEIETGLVDPSKAAAEALDKLAASTKAAFESVAIVASAPTISADTWAAGAANLRSMIPQISEVVSWLVDIYNEIAEDAPQATVAANAIDAIMKPIKTLMEGMNLLYTSEQGTLDGILAHTRPRLVEVVRFFSWIYEDIIDFAGDAMAAAQAVDTIVKPLKALMDGMSALYDGTQGKLDGILAHTRPRLVEVFRFLMWLWEDVREMATDAASAAGAVEAVMKPIKSLMDGMAALYDAEQGKLDGILAHTRPRLIEVFRFLQWINEDTLSMREAASGGAAAVEIIMKPIKALVDGMAALYDAEQGKLDGILAHTRPRLIEVFKFFSWIWEDVKLLVPEARKGAEVVGIITEQMSNTIQMLAELKAFKWAEDLPEKFKKLRQAMEEVVLHMYKMRMKVGDMVSDDLVKFVRAIGELSDGLLSAVRLMTDLSTATLRFDSDLIGGFAGMIEDMINALREQIEAFDIEKEPLIKAFSEALGSVMGGLKAALEVALMFPEGFTEPDETTWEFFTGWVKRTFKRLESWIKTNWTYDGTNDPFDIVTLFGAALSSIMDGLKTSLELALMFPVDFKEPNDMTWEFFTGWVKRTFKRLESWINTNWTYDGTNDPFGIVTLFGDALGSLMGGLRAALETALLLPADWSPPNDETWGDFEDWVKNVFDSFKAYLTKELKTDKDGAAVDDPYGIVKSFAEALSPLMSGLGAALNLALAQPANWPVLDMASWKPFFEWVEDVMDSFIAYVEENYPQTEAEADQFAPVQAFGSAMGAVMGGLSSALGVLGGIVTYIAPLDSQIEAFIAGVKNVMSKITTYAKGDAVQAGNEATTAFANAMSAVFSGLQTALSVFSSLYDKGAGFAGWLAGAATNGSKFDIAMGELYIAITLTLQKFKSNVQSGFTSDWSPAAEAFATAVERVFAVLRNALGVFGDIESQGLPDLDTLRAFVRAVLEVFGMFTQGLLDAEKSAMSIGDNYVNTIVSSLQEGQSQVYIAAYDLGYEIVAGVKYATQSNSPSREAIWVANNYVDSIVATLQGRTDSVRQAARELGDAMTPAGMSDYDYASAQPALVVRVEGDISLGGQNVDPATANQIAGMLVNQLRIGA
jgi:phage-related minor tail protein